MTPGTPGRRALQITGRTLALLVAFAAAFVSAAFFEIGTSLPIDPAYTPALVGLAVSGALVFGWALADGRRSDPADRTVRLWVAAVAVAATMATVLVLGFWFFLAAAQGGSSSGVDLIPLAGYGLLTAALITAAGVAVAAVGVRAGRARSISG